MQLYTNPASPFCRKVHVVLHETGLHDGVEEISAIGHPTAAENMPTGINPLGKIPTLTREDGPALYDSRVICRYLDHRAGSALHPESRLWEVLTLEATGDGICDAAVLMVYEGRARPEEKRHDPWVDGQWAKIDRALDVLEDRWLSLLQGPLTIGQIAVGCALGYLDLRHGERNWRAGRDGLAGWYAGFSERASMQATRPAGWKNRPDSRRCARLSAGRPGTRGLISLRSHRNLVPGFCHGADIPEKHGDSREPRR